MASSAIVVVPPADDALDAFKEDVRTWFKLDESIRDLQAQLRERSAAKRAMTARIGGFMSRYNVEDLRTAGGARLRYRVSMVKAPLTHGDVRDRLARHVSCLHARLGGDASAADAEVRAATDALFARDKVERAMLRKLPPARGRQGGDRGV